MKNLHVWSGLGHTFLRYDDPSLGAIFIDPTFAQVQKDFKDIFVGTEAELRDAVPATSAVDIFDFIPPSRQYPPLRIERDLMK